MSDTQNTEVQELTDGASGGAIAPLAAAAAAPEPLDNTLYYHVSQLPDAAPITGDEVMEIIQGGKNVKVKVAGFKGAKGEAGATGVQGVAGADGKNGLSAFAVAQANGFVGTEAEWLATLKGEKGKDGLNGVDGLDGEDGAQGIQGIQGVEGKSAYELAVIAGFEGDEAAWIASLKGKDGVDGEVGETGKSAYEVAVAGGFEGDEAAWLESLKGADGTDGAKGEEGLSAYQVAVNNGFEGDEPAWLESLKGKDGTDGTDGAAGKSAQEILQEGFPDEDLSTPELMAAFLTGPRGPQGMRGADGPEGPAGKDGAAAAVGDSAYQSAVKGGFEGTEEEWLKSLEGKDAYEVSVEAGFEGTREEWLASLGGIKGDTGAAGKDGADGKSALEQLQEQYPEAGIDSVEHMAEFLKGNAGETGPAGKDGINGVDGKDGVNGKSAYELAKDGGATGTEAEWIASLTGTDGKSAYELAKAGGFEGTEEEWITSLTGATGAEGKSAYELAKEGGFEGTQPEWIASLHGKSAFELAVAAGFQGDEAAWRASLKGDKGEAGTNGKDGVNGADGAAGKSAYQIAVDGGFSGTEAEWTASLKGDKGDTGKGVKIAGSYENVSELPDAADAEEAGQMFFVGSHLYAPINGEWIDIGDLRGLEGLGLNIRGTLTTVDELPIDNNRKGDAFIISSNKTMVVFDSEKWSEVGQVGPKGESAYDLAVANGFIGSYAEWALTQVGPAGEKGEPGEKGEKGEPANAIHVKGRVSNVEALPVDAAPADGYFVARNLYVYDGEAWVDCGELYAKSSYDIAVDRGFPGTQDEWLESLVGPTGAQGPQGLKGEKGDMPPGLRLRGTVASSDLLPPDAELSDAYLIGDHTWAFGDAGWFDAGIWRGPQGIQGPQGLKGDTGSTGKGLVVVGQVASAAELPVSTEQDPIALGTAYSHTTTRDVYIFGKQGWFNAGQLQGPVGPQGIRGIQGPQGISGPVGQRGPMGYRGPVGARGPQGLQGVAGKDGAVGKQLVITGRKTNQSQLPGSATIGTAYIIYNTDLSQDRVWIFGEAGWFDSGILQGPKGETGATGAQGIQGPVGPQGKALNLKGTVATVGDLPAGALEGESYQVTATGDVHLKTATGWANIGPLRGPQGPQGIQGIQGIQGVAGIQGRGLNVKGSLPSTTNLPPSGNTIGDAYIINEHCWIWGTGGWFDAGLVAGVDAYDVYVRSLPAGENAMSEAAWIASLKGDPGEKGADGASGASIRLMGRVNVIADLPANAAPGDAYAIDRDIHVRMADGTWENFGEIVGPEGARGPEGPQGPTGKQGIAGSRGAKGDTGRSLILGDHDPQAADGVIGDTFVNITTQGVWLKSTALLWTFQGYFGGGNVYKPADTTKTYVWKNGWVEFNRYDLASVTVTGVCDAATSNVFVLDNTANTAKTISFANLPAGRVATFVVIINGKAGNMTWPAGVIWNNATAPELGTTVTSVVFLYDGTRLIGSVGATA